MPPKSMTDRRKEVLEVFNGEGNRQYRATAAILGIHRTTVKDHVLKSDQLAPVSQARIHELEKLLKQQDAALANYRKAQFSLPTAAKHKKSGKSFCRVIIPDTHGCKIDKEAAAILLSDIEKLCPLEIVWLGDHLDCGGFLAQHHVMGYVADTLYTFEEDVAAANHFMDRVQEAAPGSDHHYLEGNHERRIEKWIVTQTLQNPKDAQYLHNLFSVEKVLHIKERGINFYKQGVRYHDLPIPATIKLGHCHFTHGSSTSKNAAKAHVEMFSGNVVYGHTHRPDSFSIRTVKEGLISAWSPGCLCELQPLWQHTSITGWGHGYGLQIVQPSGEFLHINIPILDGKSYLMDLTEKLNAPKKTNTPNKKRTGTRRSDSAR